VCGERHATARKASRFPSAFALGGQAMPRAFATKIVEQTHEHWRSLHISDGKSTV